MVQREDRKVDAVRLLTQVLEGSYREISPDAEAEADRRELIDLVNRLHRERQELVEGYTADLRRSEARLSEIIEATPIGLCITDRYGYFEYVNPTYCNLYGYTQEELLGRHFTMVVPEEHRSWLDELHDRFMGRRYELRGEWPVVRRDGTQLTVLASAAYIIGSDNQPKKVTFVVDITERKAVENQLQQTIDRLNGEMEERRRIQKAKEEVERIIRHDLRNPLNGILNGVQLLRRGELSREQLELVDLIEDAGRKLHKMISSSMDFARMEQGTHELRPQPLNLVELVADVDSEISGVKQSHGVTVHYFLDGDPLSWDERFTVYGEEIYLEDMLANLLRNAVEASPTDGSVTVRIRTGDRYRIDIHNAGTIPEEIRGAFFERYTTHGKHRGSGLGTYVAELIVRTHQGDIWFTTDEEEGTHVFVELPKLPLKEMEEIV